MSSDLSAKRVQLESQLRAIKQQERKEAFATINICLEKWHKHLLAKAVQIDDQGDKKYKLIIKPYVRARDSCLQSISYLNLTNRETKEWDFETYSNNVRSSEPLVFYADNLTDLMPPTGDDWVWIAHYGIVFEIQLNDDASDKAHQKTMDSVRQLYNEIARLKDKLQNVKTVFSNEDQALQGIEILKSTTSQKRSFEAMSNSLAAGTESCDFKTIDRKLKKLRKDIQSL